MARRVLAEGPRAALARGLGPQREGLSRRPAGVLRSRDGSRDRRARGPPARPGGQRRTHGAARRSARVVSPGTAACDPAPPRRLERLGIDLSRDDPALAGRLRALAAEARVIFVTGLPGTGKSLVIRGLADLAAGAGRTVHTLQWDVARPVFEASPVGRRYPLVDGVTHVVIRKAAGLWVRGALADWHAANPSAAHVLIGELPLVGGRFIELARP